MLLLILTKSCCLALSAVFLFLSVQVNGKPEFSQLKNKLTEAEDANFSDRKSSLSGMDVRSNLYGRALTTDLEADMDIQPGSSTTQFSTNATSLDGADQQSSGERQTICINEASGGSWCHENYKCCSRGNNKFYCCPNNRNCCPGENCCGSAGSCATGNPCGNNSLCCPYGDGYTCCRPNEKCCGGRCCSQSP